MADTANLLRATTAEMANRASVDMELWDRHSNAALRAADEIERRTTMAEYQSMILCPDGNAGYDALHEAVQEGWEVLCQWQETTPRGPANLICLRKPADGEDDE